MPGIRVQHPTQKNVRYTVVEGDKPYPVPYTCTPPEFGGCGSTHLFKTHHLNLDDTGAVILSPGVFDRIKHRLDDRWLLIANEVAKPPQARHRHEQRQEGQVGRHRDRPLAA